MVLANPAHRAHFIAPNIVHVQVSVDSTFADNGTGVIQFQPQKFVVKNGETETELSFRSSQMSFFMDKVSKTISFEDKDENPLFEQITSKIRIEPSIQEKIYYDESSAHVEETANGKVTVKDIVRRDTIGRSTRYIVKFCDADDIGLYGLGAHMEDYMNLQGKTVYLTQHNLKASVPLLLSATGYGLLFDAGCAIKFESKPMKQDCGHTSGYCYEITMEAAKTFDYYVIYGPKMEDIVAGYHQLTGKVSMMPRYLFGYTQSKERYVSTDDILRTLGEYRRRHVPIDMIVQDWNYWPQGWGYMKMNSKYYPSPKALADSVHALNAKLMISIWPNPQWCPEAEDFKKQGLMLEHDIYDAFRPEGRDLYWKYANDEFFSQGFDAWWCDSSEPLDGDWNRIPKTTPDGKAYGWDSQAYRYELNKNVLSEALGSERSNLFSLYHSMGIYEHQRATDSSKRVVNLTRSSYSGQQRYGTVVWNGDTHASWESFRQQIPSGLNYMATGNPYWTVDVGSFFTRNSGRQWFYIGEFPQGVKDDAYKEYYTRMFQWGTFLPMLRSHGSDTPREIWQFGEPGTPYYDAILRMINLRYQHVPYLYSMAATLSGLVDCSNGHSKGGMARALVFDFPTDTTVLDLKDQYMFGDYLVCPITHPIAEQSSRNLYLPKGNAWYDYWTGQRYEGGQWISVKSEIARLPIFVRAGSIIPTTEVAEYTQAQVGLPVTFHVYPGVNAEFTLYEDEGDNYNFEQGAFSTIPVLWNDAAKTITFEKRKGSYTDMPAKRTFIVSTPNGTKTIEYVGKKIKVKM